jgi:Ca2+-binding RTX toxin-like protein
MFFEILENRRMLSVTVSLDPATRVLSIIGDEQANNIEVRQEEADEIEVIDRGSFQVLATFLDVGVDAVRFEGNAGDDRFAMVDLFEGSLLNEPATILGGAGNDSLNGATGADFIDGGSGNDTIDGGILGNDSLFGGTGADSLSGRSGNDLLDGGFGADAISGGSGTDTVDFTSRVVRVTVDLRQQSGQAVHGEQNERDTISSIENANGGLGSDILIGNGGANRLRGNGGQDKIKGLGGNDNLVGGNGHDSVFGGAGDDNINGNAGNDLLSGDAGADTMDGGSENDVLIGGTGADAMFGGAGDDFLFAQDGERDSVVGNAGNDLGELDGVDVSIQRDLLEELLGQ